MGGRETVRGVLLQTLVCCKEIFSRDWEMLKFEPTYIESNQEKEVEKVDILFSSDNGKRYALQVKSSINLFTKPNLIRLLEEIKSDVKADFYELHLVGTCNSKAQEYIKQVNETIDARIICTHLDIENIEDTILEKAKSFLTSKNIGWKSEKLYNKIKIICYELLKNALNDDVFSSQSIMDLLTSIDDQDLMEFCKLIRDRLSKRIEIILEFYENTYALFGFETPESKSVLSDNVKKIKDIDNEYKVKIDIPLKNIQDDEKYYSYMCKEYLEEEDKSIKVFLDDLNIPQEYYHRKHKLTYHLKLRSEINKLINSYNQIDKIVSKKYNLSMNQKELFENQDDIIIEYSNLEDLENKIQSLDFKEQEYPRILTFSDDETKLEILSKHIKGNRVIINISEGFREEDMLDFIISTNEAFTEDGSFSPQLYITYVIFLLNVSENIKYELEGFKSRSTIKYIFEKQVIK